MRCIISDIIERILPQTTTHRSSA